MDAHGAARMVPDMKTCFREFTRREDAAMALADDLQKSLSAAVQEKGQASLVVSGGTTPAGMFRLLSQRNLPWDRVKVLASDERDVPPDHADRNEAMIRRELLQGAAARAQLVSLVPPGDIPGFFDELVLGMGADGHTASLFPDSPELGNVLDSVHTLEWLTTPSSPVRRISLTPRALLQSGRISLLFFGKEKRVVYEAAESGTDLNAFPVRGVLCQEHVPVSVYWAP